MSATTNETVEVLSDLVQIHKDRILHYEHASKQLINKDIKLEALITRLIGESYKHKLDLTSEIQNFGIVDPGSIYRGKIYRDWLDQKTSFEDRNVRSVLENCEKLEDAIQSAYITAQQEDLESNARSLVKEQQTILKKSQEEIRFLCNFQ